MGLQLSVLFGCAGAIELLACLKHVVVCKMQLLDANSHCKVEYFHRPPGVADDFVIVDKSSCLEDESEQQACSEIEAILRQNKAEPNVLFIAPPPLVEGYVRVPTPIPFGMDDEVPDQKSGSSNSSVDSGNENPTRQTPVETSPVQVVKSDRGSSSDVSSLEDTENHYQASQSKKVLRRSKTPDVPLESSENPVVEEKLKTKKLRNLATTSKKSLKPKLKTSEQLRRSAENLATTTARRSKRQRDPERCKSEIQVSSRRDEWTNTSPVGSYTDVSNDKKSNSVFIQTSFEDKLKENTDFQSVETATNTCPNCRCGKESSRVRKVVEAAEADGKPQLVKISSFEEASDDDYNKLRDSMKNGKRSWTEKVKSSVESESLDEYVDAEEEGMTFCEQPIQFSIPDHGDNQAFWVIARPYTRCIPIF